MKRHALFASLLALMLATAALIAAAPAPAQSILYTFTGLPGQAATCVWFDDNLNDRSLDALIRQTDLLYNRIALPAGQPITVSQTVTSKKGTGIVEFQLGGKIVCTGADAVNPPTPEPSPTAFVPPS